MERHEVEVTVGWILDNLQRHVPVEDDARVELKRSWPANTADAARRIAAHANCARGDEIIWIIGADEKASSVPGATGQELAVWYDQVSSHFENRWAPTLRSYLVPWGDTTVVALVFETEGAPFQVKRGDYLEVPWRGATQTRSARRHELLSLLSPAIHMPDVELRAGRLGQARSPSNITPLSFRLALSAYITPNDERRIVLPFHRMAGAIFGGRGDVKVTLDHFEADVNRLVSPFGRAKVDIDSPFVQITQDEVIISGPCRIRILAFGREREFDILTLRDECVVEVSLRPATTTASILLRPHFVTTGAEDDEEAAWLYVPEHILRRRR